MHPSVQIPLHLIDIWFLTCICMWQILKVQTCLHMVVGPGLVSTSPAFMRSIASGSAWMACPKISNRAPIIWGRRGLDNLQTAVTAPSRVGCVVWSLVPNLPTPITCTYSERRVRSCVVSHVNMGQLSTPSYNSLRWRSIRMFNKLPEYVCIVSSCSEDKFKSQLDKHLKNIPASLDSTTGWWRLFEWRSLGRQPCCQLDVTETTTSNM